MSECPLQEQVAIVTGASIGTSDHEFPPGIHLIDLLVLASYFVAIIKLPALVDAGLMTDEPEQINKSALRHLPRIEAQDKWFGAASDLELVRGSTPNWYGRVFFLVTASCVGLVAGTRLLTRLLFVWRT